MKALFTVQPAIGHLHPLVPVARALERAGHDVAFCSSASFRPEVEVFGFEYFDAGLDWLTSDRTTWTSFPPMPPPPDPAFPAFVVKVFADITTGAMVPDVLAIAEEWRPDMVVREVMEWGGCIAAELLGLPHASVGGNAYSGLDSPAINYFPGNRHLVAEALARHRAQFGLSPDPDVQTPFRHLHMCFMPRRWDRPDLPSPAHTHYLSHTNVGRPGEALPAWVRELPDQPTVFAALGTIAHAMPGIFEAILDGLRNEPLNVILAVGQDPSCFGEQPANVRIERYLPQTRLLPHCDLFITHGGFNSVKESLSFGIPLVVVPIMSDEPYSAERCDALGVARVVGPDNRTPEAIHAAVRSVLADPSYRANAEAFKQEMLALPGPDRIVALLTKLALEPAAAFRLNGFETSR